MIRLFRRGALLTGIALLAGCASYSGIAPEARQLDGAALERQAAAIPTVTWPKTDWWQDFHDPVLSGLIGQALADSPNLQASVARLNRAKAVSGLAESALWPQVNASLSSNRQRFSEHGLIPPPYAGTRQNVNELQFGGQWEIDFFGKNRAGLEAAIGELRANEADHQAARQMLATNVARRYYNLAQQIAQRALAEQRKQQRSDLAGLVERRFKAGLDTRVELESAQGTIPESARDIAALDAQIAVSRHALAVLTGQAPNAVDDIAPTLPQTSPLALPAALPANLLGHRADVAAARWRVESALHGLEYTQAMFYPNINLRFFTGFSAIGFDHWLDAGSRVPGIGIAVSLPIFDAGRLRSLYHLSAGFVDSSVSTYNATLLDALRDVADQLSTLQALETQLTHQKSAEASAQRSYDLALQRFQADISDRLNVLDVATKLIAQQQISVDLQARRIDTRILLIHALGGGFTEDPAPAVVPVAASEPVTN